MTTVLDDPLPRYRLLHSSGEQLAADRAAALAWLAKLPGAKLFVLKPERLSYKPKREQDQTKGSGTGSFLAR